uniref:Uncharacterized protein n=1 Tax=Octopus bimaculoides TaxID=37653 RepID=A0A0L8H7X5_OCTBM
MVFCFYESISIIESETGVSVETDCPTPGVIEASLFRPVERHMLNNLNISHQR